MRDTNTIRVGGLALVVAGVAGAAWFGLEMQPPALGFDDTDSPAESLRYLRAHGQIYAWAGLSLLLLAASLTVGVLATADALSERSDGLAARSVSAAGLLAAACFFLHGVVRNAVGPLLYVADLDADWGEAAYLVLQFVGIHGFAMGGVVALCLWAVGVSVVGWRSRSVPLAVCLLGVVPAFRVVGSMLGPFGIALDGLWLLAMAAIPGTFVWCMALGLGLLARARRASTAFDVSAPAGVR